jgi:hypothetical protein
MTTYDLRQAFLSKFAGKAQFCVQILWLVLIAAVAIPAMGQAVADNIRYVSPNGSDGIGTSWATAFHSIGEALSGLNACTSYGSCVIHISPAGITLISTFTLNRAQTTIDCEPGAIITMEASSGNQFVITAGQTRVTGCAFSYSSGNDAAIVVEPAGGNPIDGVTIDHNLFEGFPGGTGANTTLLIQGTSGPTFVSDVNVTDNTFWNNLGNNINLQDNVQRANISRNLINASNTASGAPNNQLINAQPTSSGTMQGLVVSGNIMFNGLVGNCVQIQGPTGSSADISDVTVSSNICTLISSSSTVGTGYSITGSSGLTVVGNVFDANGQELDACTNAPFEFVNVENGTESGNSATLGNQAVSSETSSGKCPSNDKAPTRVLIFTVIGNGGQSVSNTFTGNSASVDFTDTTSGHFVACWNIGGGGSTGTISRNTFTGNNCDMSSSAGAAVGFFMQTAGNGTINNNFVSENSFLGADQTGDAGICLELDTGGIMQSNVVGFNNVFNFHLPYCQNLLGQVSGFATGTILTGLTSPSF